MHDTTTARRAPTWEEILNKSGVPANAVNKIAEYATTHKGCGGGTPLIYMISSLRKEVERRNFTVEIRSDLIAKLKRILVERPFGSDAKEWATISPDVQLNMLFRLGPDTHPVLFAVNPTKRAIEKHPEIANTRIARFHDLALAIVALDAEAETDGDIFFGCYGPGTCHICKSDLDLDGRCTNQFCSNSIGRVHMAEVPEERRERRPRPTRTERRNDFAQEGDTRAFRKPQKRPHKRFHPADDDIVTEDTATPEYEHRAPVKEQEMWGGNSTMADAFGKLGL